MMRSQPRVAAAVVVIVIVAIAFVTRWLFLAQTPFPLGIDGFYYAVQLRSLLENQRLYYPASPLAFWLMLPSAWALGPIPGMKLGAALGTALAALPVYAIVRRATGDRAAGILGAALVATSAGSFHLATEFVKQAVGLTLALAFAASFAALLDEPDNRRRRLLAVATGALFVATMLAHLTSVGIAVLFALPPIAVRVLKGERASRRRAIAIGVAGLIALLVLIALVVPTVRSGMGLANMFGTASFAFTGEHTFHHEVLLGAITGATLLIALRITRRNQSSSAESRAALIGPALLGVMLAFPWLSVQDPQGLAFRLRIMAFVPLALCASAALSMLLARFAPRLRQIGSLAGAGLVISLVPLKYTDAVAWPSGLQVPGIEKIAAHTPPDAIIVVDHRQLSFMVKWIADREARRHPPASGETRPVFRLASIGVLPTSVVNDFDAVEQRLPVTVPRPVELHSRGRMRMFLFAEPTWQALLGAVSPQERAALEPWPGVR